MAATTLGPHEALEIHEVLNFKTVALTKAKLMQGIVFDKELKAMMQKEVELGIRHVRELREIYAGAPFHREEARSDA